MNKTALTSALLLLCLQSSAQAQDLEGIDQLTIAHAGVMPISTPATVLLHGYVESDSLKEFFALVDRDYTLDCQMRNTLQNEFGHALPEMGRKKRWKRLIGSDLMWQKKASLQRVEFLAAACGIPLR